MPVLAGNVIKSWRTDLIHLTGSVFEAFLASFRRNLDGAAVIGAPGWLRRIVGRWTSGGQFAKADRARIQSLISAKMIMESMEDN